MVPLLFSFHMYSCEAKGIQLYFSHINSEYKTHSLILFYGVIIYTTINDVTLTVII